MLSPITDKSINSRYNNAMELATLNLDTYKIVKLLQETLSENQPIKTVQMPGLWLQNTWIPASEY
jgi:hypothetical protein